MDDLEVTVEIRAPADRVWALIGDPTRMDGLTAECDAMRWAGGRREPGIGARFRGRNRRGWRRWSTTCTIVRYEAGREIAWDVHAGPLAVAEWSYRAEDGPDGGTILTERFVDRRGPLLRATGPLVRGVRDTEGHNRANMAETLARIRARAEA